jgi:hypothetical protein
MTRRLSTSWVLAAGVMLAPLAWAETPQAFSRDLTGIWTNASLTPLTRARGVESLTVSEEEARRMAAGTAIAGVAPDESFTSNYSDPNAGPPEKGGQDFGLRGYDAFWVTPGEMLGKVRGEYRTSNIVDPPSGQLPYRDPASVARKQMAGFVKYATGNHPYEGPEATELAERCLIGFGGTGGPGMLSVLYNNNYQFVLTPDHLMVLVEMAHDARIIPIYASADIAMRSHKPDVITPWLGDSVAWWEGDTLVARTVNVNPQQAQNHPFLLSPKAVVTERFTRTGEEEIFYEFTVDDPETYTQPWRAELTFYPQSRLYEYACHEGNYGLEGILAGARLKERQSATTP